MNIRFGSVSKERIAKKQKFTPAGVFRRGNGKGEEK